MDRDTAAAEMQRRLSLLFEETELGTTDIAGEMKEPLDDALRLMGYVEAELVDAAPTDVPSYLTTLRYFTLKAMLDRLSIRFDISADGDSFRLGQVRDAVEKLLAAAAKDVLAIYGRLTISDASAAIITLDLNFKQNVSVGEAFA